MRRIVVLLPSYNEDRALPGLLERLTNVRARLQPDFQLSVLVVDDGSTDQTAAMAQRKWGGLPVTVLQHQHNQGLGAALLTGIMWYLQQPEADNVNGVLAVMDADTTHPPEILPQMLCRLDGNEKFTRSDVVIASRYAAGGEEHGLSWQRRLYSKLASTVMKFAAHTPGVRDYSCGYRLYRRRALQAGIEHFGTNKLVTETGFTCMAELLVKLGRCDCHIAEVPLKLHYELKVGASKMNVPATIRRYFALVWHMMFDRAWR